jgi:FkbM family methyltransferase
MLGYQRLLERIRTSYGQAKAVRNEGNLLKSAVFFGFAVLHSKRLVSVAIRSKRILIRPNTPDFEVARGCFNGEYTAAIEASQPLRFNLIVDAGGYIGTAAIEFAKAFPNARIVTLEPSRNNFEVLCKNVRKFPNIVALNKALGTSSGVIALGARHTGEWGYTTVEDPADCRATRFLHNVEVTTIPTLLREFNSDGVDLLKLDIEGAEFELLRDLPSWLAKTRVIVAELHDRIVPGCVDAFAKATKDRKQIYNRGEKVLSIA